jgi:hypothetical protein
MAIHPSHDTLLYKGRKPVTKHRQETTPIKRASLPKRSSDDTHHELSSPEAKIIWLNFSKDFARQYMMLKGIRGFQQVR